MKKLVLIGSLGVLALGVQAATFAAGNDSLAATNGVQTVKVQPNTQLNAHKGFVKKKAKSVSPLKETAYNTTEASKPKQKSHWFDNFKHKYANNKKQAKTAVGTANQPAQLTQDSSHTSTI